jgi:hypothetical protein
MASNTYPTERKRKHRLTHSSWLGLHYKTKAREDAVIPNLFRIGAVLSLNKDPEGLNAGFKCSIFSREIPSALFKIDNVFGCFGEDGRLGKFVRWDVRVTHERCNEEKQISKSRTARGWDMIVKKYLIKLRWHL